MFTRKYNNQMRSQSRSCDRVWLLYFLHILLKIWGRKEFYYGQLFFLLIEFPIDFIFLRPLPLYIFSQITCLGLLQPKLTIMIWCYTECKDICLAFIVTNGKKRVKKSSCNALFVSDVFSITSYELRNFKDAIIKMNAPYTTVYDFFSM